ncbi:MAG: T9SS type A sorting domain-containing protein [Bacteroidota bacterium]
MYPLNETAANNNPIHKRCAPTLKRFRAWHWLVAFVLLFGLTLATKAQTRIDSTFAFQTDPAKKYSLYVPSTYDANQPNSMMVGLHPFNTARWDAESWCDTLIVFAETNGLILMCPDGGTDGQVDDPIDQDFTTALMDSMQLWYNVDPGKVYAMGFSWGGLTTYTYGLRDDISGRFCGYMPIGAAINSGTVTGALAQEARNKPVYIVHGANDNANNRYWPAVNILTDSGAVLNSLLMPGVGHTIDFANRNQILTDAFQWIDSVCVNGVGTSLEEAEAMLPRVYPTILNAGERLFVEWAAGDLADVDMAVFDVRGMRVESEMEEDAGRRSLKTDHWAPGIYILTIRDADFTHHQKILIR